jgi:hypothetical protein
MEGQGGRPIPNPPQVALGHELGHAVLYAEGQHPGPFEAGGVSAEEEAVIGISPAMTPRERGTRELWWVQICN